MNGNGVLRRTHLHDHGRLRVVVDDRALALSVVDRTARGVGQGEVQDLVVFEQPIPRARRYPSSSWSRSRRTTECPSRIPPCSPRERTPSRSKRHSPPSLGIRRVVAPGDGKRKVARPRRTFPRAAHRGHRRSGPQRGGGLVHDRDGLRLVAYVSGSEGDEIITVNVSSVSSVRSPITLIKTALLVSPGAKCNVPDPPS